MRIYFTKVAYPSLWQVPWDQACRRRPDPNGENPPSPVSPKRCPLSSQWGRSSPSRTLCTWCPCSPLPWPILNPLLHSTGVNAEEIRKLWEKVMTISLAISLASLSSFNVPPVPNFTSRTSASNPSAAFFEIIDPAVIWRRKTKQCGYHRFSIILLFSFK